MAPAEPWDVTVLAATGEDPPAWQATLRNDKMMHNIRAPGTDRSFFIAKSPYYFSLLTPKSSVGSSVRLWYDF
jgi:hypothetical protein